MEIQKKEIGIKNNSPDITEINDNHQKNKKTKNQSVLRLTVFPAKRAPYRGHVVPLKVEKKSKVFES